MARPGYIQPPPGMQLLGFNGLGKPVFVSQGAYNQSQNGYGNFLSGGARPALASDIQNYLVNVGQNSDPITGKPYIAPTVSTPPTPTPTNPGILSNVSPQTFTIVSVIAGAFLFYVLLK